MTPVVTKATRQRLRVDLVMKLLQSTAATRGIVLRSTTLVACQSQLVNHPDSMLVITSPTTATEEETKERQQFISINLPSHQDMLLPVAMVVPMEPYVASSLVNSNNSPDVPVMDVIGNCGPWEFNDCGVTAVSTIVFAHYQRVKAHVYDLWKKNTPLLLNVLTFHHHRQWRNARLLLYAHLNLSPASAMFPITLGRFSSPADVLRYFLTPSMPLEYGISLVWQCSTCKDKFTFNSALLRGQRKMENIHHFSFNEYVEHSLKLHPQTYQCQSSHCKQKHLSFSFALNAPRILNVWFHPSQFDKCSQLQHILSDVKWAYTHNQQIVHNDYIAIGFIYTETHTSVINRINQCTCTPMCIEHTIVKSKQCKNCQCGPNRSRIIAEVAEHVTCDVFIADKWRFCDSYRSVFYHPISVPRCMSEDKFAKQLVGIVYERKAF